MADDAPAVRDAHAPAAGGPRHSDSPRDTASLDRRIRALAPPRWVAFVRSVGPLAVGVLVAMVLQLYVKQWIGGYWEKILIDIGINVVLAVSLNIVNGYTGQFSIGHAGFMAIGGYTAGYIMYYGTYHFFGDVAFHGGVLSSTVAPSQFAGPLLGGGDLLFLGSIIAGGLVAAVFGFIVGLPSLRLRGDYLAIVTLGFGEIVRVVIETTKSTVRVERIGRYSWYQLMGRVGGPMGFDGLPFYSSLFWVYAVVVVTLLAAYRIKTTTFGRAFLAIRENEIAAAALGVPTTRYKVRAFVVAAFFGGGAGALFAHEVGNILNPGDLGFLKSFDIIIMVVLGGMGSISGAAVAAVLLTILPEWLREPTHVWPLGVAVIVVLAIARRGKRPGTALWVAGATVAFEGLRFLALHYEIKLADYRMIFYALSLILIMVLRPQGIFGLGEVWDWLPRRRATS